MFVIFLVFTALFLVSWRLKKRLMTAGNLVLFMYALSSGCALGVYKYYPPTATIESVLYLIVGVTLCIWPFVRGDIFELPRINGPRERAIINNFSIAAIVMGALGITAFIGNAVKALYIGVGDVRNDVFEGNMLNEGGIMTWGLVGNIAMIAAGSWMLNLILACLSAITTGRSLRTILLFVASLCGIPFGISCGGRSPIIYYSLMLTFMVIMLFGRGQMLRRNRALIVGVLVTFLVGVFGYSYYVADRRDLVTAHIYSAVPAKTREGATLFTMLDYAGQGIVNFHSFWAIRWTDERLYHGGMNFPLVAGILERLEIIGDYSHAEVTDDMMTRYEYEGGFGATFSTFLREFIMDFGELGTLLVCAFMGLGLQVCLVRYNRYRDLGSLILITCIASIPFLGFFYSYLPSMYGTGTFFIPLAAGLFLRFFGGKRKSVSNDSPVELSGRRTQTA